MTSVAMLFIFFGAQGVFISFCILGAFIAGAQLSGDETAALTTNAIGLLMVGPFLLLEALKVVGGVALLRRWPWARIFVLVLAFLSLFLPPIGTAYGIYAIVVLLKDDSVRWLASAAPSG